MNACGKFGVRTVKLSIAVCLLLGTQLGGCTAVFAAEFGNVFGPPQTEAASRDASARALEGLMLIIDGFRDRELRNQGSSIEKFKRATDVLMDAGSRMKAIQLPSEVFIFSISGRLVAEENRAIAIIAELHRVRSVSTFGDLYNLFQLETTRLAQSAERLSVLSAQTSLDRSLYIDSNIALDIARYVMLASAVTRTSFR